MSKMSTFSKAIHSIAVCLFGVTLSLGYLSCLNGIV